ncbi:hypothetical protein TNCV_2744641 [Trichonephila clavipes]|nr:hypothetical protein TNCV_2744641 [Trichonephila clavipes]
MHRYKCPCGFNITPQLINRSGCPKVTSYVLDKHGLDIFYCLKSSCSHVLRAESPCCYKRRRNVPVDACCLENDPNYLLRARDVAVRSLSPCE